MIKSSSYRGGTLKHPTCFTRVVELTCVVEEPFAPASVRIKVKAGISGTGLGCVLGRLAASRALPLQGMWLEAVDFH